MKLFRTALLATAALVLPAAPALADDHAPTPSSAAVAAPAAAAEAPQTERDKLFALFADSDVRNLEINPLSRLFRGDDKDAGRLGDFLAEGVWCGSVWLATSEAETTEVFREKMIAVNRVLDVLRRTPARLAPEGQEHQAP